MIVNNIGCQVLTTSLLTIGLGTEILDLFSKEVRLPGLLGMTNDGYGQVQRFNDEDKF